MYLCWLTDLTVSGSPVFNRTSLIPNCYLILSVAELGEDWLKFQIFLVCLPLGETLTGLHNMQSCTVSLCLSVTPPTAIFLRTPHGGWWYYQKNCWSKCSVSAFGVLLDCRPSSQNILFYRAWPISLHPWKVSPSVPSFCLHLDQVPPHTEALTGLYLPMKSLFPLELSSWSLHCIQPLFPTL